MLSTVGGGDGGGRRRGVRVRTRLSAFFVAVALLSPACGDDGGDGGDGGDGADAVELGDAKPLVDAWCAMARNCCRGAGYPAGPLADCESELLRQSDVVAAVASGDVQTVEPAFTNCVNAFRAAASTCTLGDSGFEACVEAWAGDTTIGGSCENVVECARGAEPTVCLKTESRDVGSCTSLTRGSLGDACVFSRRETENGATIGTYETTVPLVYCDANDGLFCSFSDESTCAALPQLGETCQSDCAVGLVCNAEICETPKPLGDACAASNECQSGHCGINGVCETQPAATPKLCDGDYN